MKITLKIAGDPSEATAGATKNVAKALTSTFRKGSDNLKKGGRSAIAAGGFSSKWQNAFRSDAYPKTGTSTSPRIFAYHKIKYAGQFQEPEPVVGSPYVWLPIEKNLPGGQHWSPSKYTRTIGPLRSGRHGARPILFGQVSVNSKSVPLKLTRKGIRLKKVRKIWLPVFVGVRVVNDPKKFDLNAEAERVAAEMPGIFESEWNSG